MCTSILNIIVILELLKNVNYNTFKLNAISCTLNILNDEICLQIANHEKHLSTILCTITWTQLFLFYFMICYLIYNSFKWFNKMIDKAFNSLNHHLDIYDSKDGKTGPMGQTGQMNHGKTGTLDEPSPMYMTVPSSPIIGKPYYNADHYRSLYM